MGAYIIHFDNKPWQDLDDELYYRCFEIPWFSTTKTTISRLIPYTEDSAYAHGYTEAESKYREIRDELEKQAYQRGYEDAKRQSNRDEAYNKGHNDGLKFGYERLKSLEHERVEKAYQRGYKEAYDTAYADAEEIYESGKRAMYQKGLKDAWEAARKIYGSATKHGLPTEVITKIFRDDGKENFNYWDIVEDFSPAEVIERIRQYEQKQEESEESIKEQFVTAEEVMRQYLDTFCHERSCMSCPLNTPDFTCGRGYHFISANPISDEEVRRAYIEVRQKMEEN